MLDDNYIQIASDYSVTNPLKPGRLPEETAIDSVRRLEQDFDHLNVLLAVGKGEIWCGDGYAAHEEERRGLEEEVKETLAAIRGAIGY